MKSYVATGSDSAKPDKFLAYMAPSPDEVHLTVTAIWKAYGADIALQALGACWLDWLLLIISYSCELWRWQLSKDMYDDNEDVSFSWIREYHWDVCTVLVWNVISLVLVKIAIGVFHFACINRCGVMLLMTRQHILWHLVNQKRTMWYELG